MIRPVANTEEYCLPSQWNALLVVLQDLPHHVVCLLLFPFAGDQEWFLLPATSRPQVLSIPLAGQGDDVVSRVQDRLARPVVLLQRDLFRARELFWKIEDAVDVRRPET